MQRLREIKGMKNSTAARKLTAISSFYGWCARRCGIVHENPAWISSVSEVTGQGTRSWSQSEVYFGRRRGRGLLRAQRRDLGVEGQPLPTIEPTATLNMATPVTSTRALRGRG
jgi:hypothetical protein